MFDTIGKPFFEALRSTAERRLERGHPCLVAIERAAGVGDGDATAAAQAALAALDPETLTSLMADAHKALRRARCRSSERGKAAGRGTERLVIARRPVRWRPGFPSRRANSAEPEPAT
jgi:hypothetical protein